MRHKGYKAFKLFFVLASFTNNTGPGAGHQHYCCSQQPIPGAGIFQPADREHYCGDLPLVACAGCPSKHEDRLWPNPAITGLAGDSRHWFGSFHGSKWRRAGVGAKYPQTFRPKKGLPFHGRYRVPCGTACGLYIVHCLVPPHPGAAAAAATIGADFGKLTLLGMLVAIPPLLLVHAWARSAGQKWVTQPAQADKPSEEFLSRSLPGFWQAFLPILLPLLLIAARSILINMETEKGVWQILLFLGDLVPALFLGLGLAILFSRKYIDRRQIIQLLEKTIEKAGPIILVTGAGGAFGALLTQAQLGDQLMSVPGVSNWGLILPFLLAAVLKTAQGSSTVAMISAAGIVLPLLPALGLDTENGRILATLAMGAGSMMLSHANDSYFWVISRFANIPVSVMWRSFTVCSIILSTGSLLMILLLSLFFS